MRHRSAWITEIPVVRAIAINTIKGSALASCARMAEMSTLRSAQAIRAIETMAFRTKTPIVRGMPDFMRWLCLLVRCGGRQDEPARVEVEPLFLAIDLELDTIQAPLPHRPRRLDVHRTLRFGALYRNGELRFSRRPGNVEVAHRDAAFDGSAQHSCRILACLNPGQGHSIDVGIAKGADQAEGTRDGEADHRNPHNHAGDRPIALDALELLDAFPALVAPRPLAALGAEHDHHDQVDDRHQRQQRDQRVVADSPDPVEKERAPIPAVYFARDGGRALRSGGHRERILHAVHRGRIAMEAVGVGRRAVAILIDTLLLCIVAYLIALGTGGTTSDGFDLRGGPAFLLFGIGLAYYVVMEATSGATLGKRAVGLKVVKEGGEPLDWQASIVRNLMRIVDGLFFYLVAAITVWVSKRRQRLGDMAAHTLVVKARAVVPLLIVLALSGFYHPETEAASPRYADLVLSDSKGGNAKSTFKPQTAKIFLNAKLVEVPTGAKVKSEWIAVDTGGAAPPHYRIDSVEMTVGPLINNVDFNFSKPTAGWPVGDYRVDLFIDGKPAGNVKFKVAK